MKSVLVRGDTAQWISSWCEALTAAGRLGLSCFGRVLRIGAVVLPGLVLAAEPAYTPKPGSAERRQVISALHAAVQTKVRKPMSFSIHRLKIKDGWAFLSGVPRAPTGGPMDYSGTAYQQQIDEGLFDDWICALLRREKAGWFVLAYSLGATDVPYLTWKDQYGAPPEVFDLPPQ
jgi:hypothetical protein